MGGAYVNINGTRTANKTKPTEVENMKWTLHLLRNYLFWIILSFIYIFSDFVVAVFIIYHFNKAYNFSFFCSFVCAFDTSLPTLEPLVILPLYERYPNFSYLVQKFTFIVFLIIGGLGRLVLIQILASVVVEDYITTMVYKGEEFISVIRKVKFTAITTPLLSMKGVAIKYHTICIGGCNKYIYSI